MKKILIIAFLSLFSAINAQNSLTPAEVMQKTSSILTAGKGMSADFNITSDSSGGKGSIKCMGDKFTVTLPDARVWFNGKELFTFNQRTNETTITNPTIEELSEVNPLEYVKGALKNYTPSFSATKISGKYIIELSPKSKKSEIKKITVQINAKDFIIDKIIIEPRSGQKVGIAVLNFKRGLNISTSDFEYPSSTYKTAEIIDLR